MSAEKMSDDEMQAYVYRLLTYLPIAVDRDGVISSEMLADVFDVSHNKVLRAIGKLKACTDHKVQELFAQNFSCFEVGNDKSQQEQFYLLSEKGFIALGLGGSSEKAQVARIYLMAAFDAKKRRKK